MVDIYQLLLIMVGVMSLVGDIMHIPLVGFVFKHTADFAGKHFNFLETVEVFFVARHHIHSASDITCDTRHSQNLGFTQRVWAILNGRRADKYIGVQILAFHIFGIEVAKEGDLILQVVLMYQSLDDFAIARQNWYAKMFLRVRNVPPSNTNNRIRKMRQDNGQCF